MVALLSADVPSLFQRYPTDKAYFIAKEILTTERTYLKDLEVITVVRLFGETLRSHILPIGRSLFCISSGAASHYY